MLEVMKMFDIDNPSDDKAKLIDAVACSFASRQFHHDTLQFST
jgi:hypothetical protein